MRLPRQSALLIGALMAIAVLLAPLAAAEVTQKNGVRVAVDGQLSPTRLPRRGTAPVAISVAGHITSTASSGPPQLRTLAIAINREGHLSARGIPSCRLGRIDPSTTREALEACGSALVGEGHFSADVKLPEQSPFPSAGKILAFNGRLRGEPAILAHIYGTEPVPTSYVLPFLIKPGKGTFGTTLEASLPSVTGDWGFVTGISIELRRRFTYKGKMHSFLSAGCPAPAGFAAVPFPLMKTAFGFEGGLNLTNTLTRTCRPVAEPSPYALADGTGTWTVRAEELESRCPGTSRMPRGTQASPPRLASRPSQPLARYLSKQKRQGEDRSGAGLGINKQTCLSTGVTGGV